MPEHKCDQKCSKLSNYNTRIKSKKKISNMLKKCRLMQKSPKQIIVIIVTLDAVN